MEYKIVMDSAGDLRQMEDTNFESVPLKILAGDREFVDDAQLDVNAMTDYFMKHKDASKTSCPSPGDWREGFGDADDVYCVAITGGLSGSYYAENGGLLVGYEKL